MSRAQLYRRLPLLDSDAWWLDLAAASPDGRILELGAGVGRLTAALAARGHRVTAVERDPHMLQVLRERQESDLDRVEVIEADATSLPDLGAYGLVVLPTSLLNELADPSARVSALVEATRRCRPDGRLALHVLGPWWLVRLPELVHGQLHPFDGGPAIEVSIEGRELEPCRSRRHARLRYHFPQGEVLGDDLDAAIVTPEELRSGFDEAGLELVERYGAVPPADLTPDASAWHLLGRPR